MSDNKEALRNMLDSIINDDHETAEKQFGEFMTAKSRDVYTDINNSTEEPK